MRILDKTHECICDLCAVFVREMASLREPAEKVGRRSVGRYKGKNRFTAAEVIEDLTSLLCTVAAADY